jgi:hypothetical protein
MSRVLAKEFSVSREKSGIKYFQNPGKVNLSIFRIGVVTLNE